mgnify:CR=1 FL=1
MFMARSDSMTWFALGVAQLLLGEAILEAGTTDVLAQVIKMSGGGTIALGFYFLIFLARHEDEFSMVYNKAEKLVLEVDPESGKKVLVDDSRPGIKAAWYSIPVLMTFIGLIGWLAA